MQIILRSILMLMISLVDYFTGLLNHVTCKGADNIALNIDNENK